MHKKEKKTQLFETIMEYQQTNKIAEGQACLLVAMYTFFVLSVSFTVYLLSFWLFVVSFLYFKTVSKVL